MKRIGFIVTLLTLLLSLEAVAQRYNDFAGIPFGASRETVIEEVMKLTIAEAMDFFDSKKIG